jgi:hypothetical protein
MISRRTFLAVPPALVAVSAARTLLAEPRVGVAFPTCSARDLTGRWHNSGELAQRRTFVTIITGTGGADQMRHWLNNAEARLGRGGPIVAIVALHLDFYAWDGIVRDRARASTPAWRHGYVWLDRDGNLQRALGLPNDDNTPWACVVEPGGQVSIAHHGIASDPPAQQIWARMAATP